MTFFSDLGYFQLNLATGKQGSNGQVGQINALGGNIFSKGTGLKLKSLGPHNIYGFLGQQADLPVPVTCMGITLNPVINQHIYQFNRFFIYTLFPTDI